MSLPTLIDADLRNATRDRMCRFSPQVTRHWGVMQPGEAVCHLAVCYRMVIGGVTGTERTGPLQRTVFKYAALHTPVQWAHGYPTLPEVKAGTPGVVPGDFAADRQRLLEDYDAFLMSPVVGTIPHPIFGPLTRWEWMRWGFLHADHHLRQFGI